MAEDRAVVRDSLTGNFREGKVELERIGVAHRAVNAEVQTVSFMLQPGFEVRGALWTPDSPTDVGVVVAHGHYGQGKSGAEAQDIAHRLAARGAWVLAVDTPGVEEWDVPGRRIHFDDGAHNRGVLFSRGTSAMALQVDILRRGVDVLELLGASRIGATGASGGAVQAFYLGWVDDRVTTAALASTPSIPRESAASGCPCDHVPGWPGPDPNVIAQWSAPVLWMSDVQRDRPVGLGPASTFEVFEGPHSFTEPMQRRTLAWFEAHLDLREGGWVESVPSLDLSVVAPVEGQRSIADLAHDAPQHWVPEAATGLNPRWDCSGDGPVLLALGGAYREEALEAGFQHCSLDLGLGMSTWIESVGEGRALADSVYGGVAAAVRQRPPVAIIASRGWGLVAAGHGRPFVVTDPLTSLDQLKPSDPPWVHVPGAWNGVAEARLASAAAVVEDWSEIMSVLSQ